MKNFLFLVLVCMLCSVSVQAQNYKSAIGLRLGYPVSVSYKHFLNEKGAIEAFAGYRGFVGYGWFNIAALYEHHTPISSVEGLSWYAGGGAAAYFWSYNAGFAGGSSTSFGLLGTLGLDYKVKDIPLNLSIDWMPTIFLNGYGNGFYGGYGALSGRYIFK